MSKQYGWTWLVGIVAAGLLTAGIYHRSTRLMWIGGIFLGTWFLFNYSKNSAR